MFIEKGIPGDIVDVELLRKKRALLKVVLLPLLLPQSIE